MKKLMILGVGMVVGMMLSECESMRKPIKKCLKKINIE